MRRKYLLPILAFVPVFIILYVLTQIDAANSTLIVGLVIVAYLAVNIGYSVYKKIFHVSILVELTLVSLIAYFVLTNLI